jgi:hypothetical protein
MTINIFWTGGFDSTFLICFYSIIKKQPIQPIYVKYRLDSKNGKTFRKNVDFEIQSQNKIKETIY